MNPRIPIPTGRKVTRYKNGEWWMRIGRFEGRMDAGNEESGERDDHYNYPLPFAKILDPPPRFCAFVGTRIITQKRLFG